MLELKNISLSVEDEFSNNTQKEILRDISFTVDSGKFVVITGPNGGGKSTLAKTIAGILQPEKGQILLDGEDITGMNITERAKKGISFAFQQPIRFKGHHCARFDWSGSGQGNQRLSGLLLPQAGGDCVQRIISTARSTQAFPAARSNESRLPP